MSEMCDHTIAGWQWYLVHDLQAPHFGGDTQLDAIYLALIGCQYDAIRALAYPLPNQVPGEKVVLVVAFQSVSITNSHSTHSKHTCGQRRIVACGPHCGVDV